MTAKQITILVVSTIVVVLIVIFFVNFDIVKKSTLQHYKDIENSKQSIIRDTTIIRDTIKISVASKPQIIYEDSIIEVPVLDSIALQYALKSYFATRIYKDSRNLYDKANLSIIDTLSQNTIIGRQIDLDIYRVDTVFNTAVNHIVPSIVYSPRNFIDVQFGISTNQYQLYDISYMRQFGSNKLQYRLGAGVGILSVPMTQYEPKSNTLYISLKTGIAF